MNIFASSHRESVNGVTAQNFDIAVRRSTERLIRQCNVNVNILTINQSINTQREYKSGFDITDVESSLDKCLLNNERR